MIELRWLLDPRTPPELRGNAPMSSYTLQFRYKTEQTCSWSENWSDWADVPYVSEG